MSATKRKRTAKADPTAKPIRVRSITLVNGAGVECGFLGCDDQATFLTLTNPASDFTLTLTVADDNAGLVIRNARRDSDDCCVSLAAYGKGPSGNWSEAGFGSLELHPDRPAGSSDRSPGQCGIEHEHALALRSIADGIPLETDPRELHEAVTTLRKFYRRSNGKQWRDIAMALLAGIRAADAEGTVRP